MKDYPKPLYDRAVEAYLQEFARRNGLERAGIHRVGPEEYPMYLIDGWDCTVTFDDIRLDVSGFTLTGGKHIDTTPGDMLAWAMYCDDARFEGEHKPMNYLHFLMKKYLR